MMLAWARDKGLEAKFSYEVSSDDEGVLFTVLSDDKSKLITMVRELMINISSMKSTVDSLFGVKTSFEKTTISISEIFEFNSCFYLMNTIASPKIKWVARVCDDQPEQSLHKRLTSMYSSLGQLRDNGASGYLTHLASLCQCIAFTMNLGYKSMSWFTNEHYAETQKSRLSYLGFYTIVNPLIAGLVDTDYTNWYHSSLTPESHKAISCLIGAALPEEDKTD
jgi:hypothetical protein